MKTVKKWYQEPIVWALISIPGVAVIVGMILLTLSIVSDDGLVADDYYKKGLGINQSLARDALARETGLTAHIDVDQNDKALIVKLKSTKVLLNPAAIHLRLSHATRDRLDQFILLKQVRRDEYRGEAPKALVPGRWYVQLEAAEWRLLHVIKIEKAEELKPMQLEPVKSN